MAAPAFPKEAPKEPGRRTPTFPRRRPYRPGRSPARQPGPAQKIPYRPGPSPMPAFPLPPPKPGRPVPGPVPNPPTPPYRLPIKPGKLAARLLGGWLGAAMTGYDLYEWWQEWQQPDPGPGRYVWPGGSRLCFDLGPPYDLWRTASVGTAPCANASIYSGLNGQVPSGVYGTPIILPNERWVGIFTGPDTGPIKGTRMRYHTYTWIDRGSGWPRDEPIEFEPPKPGVYTPFPDPPALPPWLDPLPKPGSAPPLPIPPPIWWPDPAPTPGPTVAPNPETTQRGQPRKARPRNEPRPGHMPSFDFEIVPGRPPAVAPNPGHKEVPPGPGEKEEKVEPMGQAKYAWLKFLDGIVNGYTETDDFVSALYQGLPWYIRRWRGRDGVWRDRDIRTDTRLKRLYQHVGGGEFSITQAIKAIAINQVTDTVIGTIGSHVGKAVGKAAGLGYYHSPVGVQHGGYQMGRTWEEALENLRLKAAKPKADARHQAKIDRYKRYLAYRDRLRRDFARAAPYSKRWYYLRNELRLAEVHRVDPPKYDDTEIPWLRKSTTYTRYRRGRPSSIRTRTWYA